MNKPLLILALCTAVACTAPIDRHALVTRNNPHIETMDPLASLSVGNGEFAFTADITGLQTFPEAYSEGVPLGTQSQWGWHSFPNTQDFSFDEVLKSYDFGRGHEELYACQFRFPPRQYEATEYFRINPHRLHLGAIGFAGLELQDIKDIDQTLDMWDGVLRSSFTTGGQKVQVETSCDPDKDMVAASITTAARIPVSIRFPYPTGQHADDACDWNSDEKHETDIISVSENSAVIRRTLDNDVYYVKLGWENASAPVKTAKNVVTLVPGADSWSFTAEFLPAEPDNTANAVAAASREASVNYWHEFWTKGGAVDFSHCTDPRAAELERRVVLSQYLLAIQCAGSTPPQETGLTYNSWYGKYHMEMIWWHQAHFALWGHEDLLARTLPWYNEAMPAARGIAERQGFKGVRWMKMTDPSGLEAPSNTGSFLIWQQPHPIYLAELLYRAKPSRAVLEEYYEAVQETAAFMADYVVYDPAGDRYVIKGCIPAQETLSASTTVNPPFELSYWHFGLSVAQEWRERMGEKRVPEWDEIINKMSKLAAKDGLYLAAENATDTYSNIRLTSDHMAVLAALGVLPKTFQMDEDIMKNTFDWVYDNWNWEQTWGWDFPTTCMNAVRLGEPEKAVNAILMDKRTNTYLPNGHNYQTPRLRCYLPGNGGLMTAVALMCAGYDGCKVKNPGFPKDGRWDVRWEGLKPMP